MENILLTRANKNSQELSRALKEAGFGVFIEPLFSVEEIAAQSVNYIADALIISSANACKTLIECDFPKDIKIFSVGKKTAEKLNSAGFQNIFISPENSAKSLKKLIIETVNPNSKIIYFHGSIISLDFAQELEKYGFAVQKILAYKTKEIADFSPELLTKCREKFFAKVLIFSENSAKIFFKIAQKNNVLEYFQESKILCLSDKISNEVKRLGFKKCATFSDLPILEKFYD